MIAGNCCRLHPLSLPLSHCCPSWTSPEPGGASCLCVVWENFMLRQLGLRKADSCVSVCVCGAVCVSAILFICIINREKENQNKIIDARIFRATTSAAAAAAGINDKR